MEIKAKEILHIYQLIFAMNKLYIYNGRYLFIYLTYVLNKILSKLKVAKYYSISVDSTSGCSHINQMTFII